MRILMTILLGLVSQPLFAESVFMVPGQSWGFQFNSPKLVHHQGTASATEFQLEASTEIGFYLSAFVEPATGKGSDSVSCMKYYWALASKNPIIEEDTVKVVATEPFAVVTYLVNTEYKEKPLVQVNANYYGYRDGYCIDVHISQVFPYEAEIDYSNMVEFGKSFGYYR